MTIDEAIELLNIAKEGFPVNDTEKYYVAMELGIEALKLVDNLHFDGSPYYPNELPGETKD